MAEHMARPPHQNSGPRPWVDLIRELDLFNKAMDEAVVTSSSGGLVALITFTFLALLVGSEIYHITGVNRVYEYGVDNEHGQEPLIINFNIDVNTPCKRM